MLFLMLFIPFLGLLAQICCKGTTFFLYMQIYLLFSIFGGGKYSSLRSAKAKSRTVFSL